MAEEKQTILVVDDEDRIRRLIRMYLEKEGYEIEEAEDGETALQKALERDYDAICWT
jgi:two-component system response regulator ResD